MSKNIILKVQGLASSFVKKDISRISKLDISEKIVFFTDLAEFKVNKGEKLNLFDLKKKKNLGKLKLEEVHLPFNRVWDSIEEGHRSLSVFEIIEGTIKSMSREIKEFNNFDLVENRFFLYCGDFKTLYNKFYKK